MGLGAGKALNEVFLTRGCSGILAVEGPPPPLSFPVSSRNSQHVTQAGLRTQKPRLSGSACKTSGHSLFYCFAVLGPVVSGMRTLMTTRSGKTLFERNYLRSCCPFGMLLLEAAPLLRRRWPGESPPTQAPPKQGIFATLGQYLDMSAYLGSLSSSPFSLFCLLHCRSFG